MRVLIKKIKINNFKGIRNKEVIFEKKTSIYGANATGKTSILDAFLWCLFGVDSLWNSKFEIRPIATDGNKIHNIEISVTVVLDVNGKEVVFERKLNENWVLKRGSSERTFQGNVGSYFVNEYPRTEQEYKREVSDLVSEDVFKMLTSPTYFPNLKWKEQRDILMRFVSDVSDYDLASGNPKFTELLDELMKAPSTDDIKAKYQKALTEWKRKQAEIPVRIDETEKLKVDIDVAELELGKKAVQELIKSNKEKQENISKQYEEYRALQDGVLDLRFKLGDLERNANESLTKKRKELQSQIDEKNGFLVNICNCIQRNNREIAGLEQDIESGTRERNRLAELWKSVNAEQFDEKTAICPTCHRELPQNEREALLSEFEKSKAERMAKIEKDGKEAKSDVDNAKEMIPKLQECNKDNLANKEKLEKEVLEFEKALSEIPTSIDVSQTDEYKELRKQISEKEEAMQKFNSADSIRKELEDESQELNAQLLEIERRIAKAEQNNEIDERIAQLQTEQRDVAQKVADQEKMIYMLEEFIRYKMDKVSADINSKFDGIRFKLFSMQINGGLKETCECTVGGVPYGSLNNGHRIIAGLQIIKALQGLYEAQMPVFVDNAESINDFNLPQMDCQLVLLKVSNDKILKVEV